jgi:hypothetical protein
MGRLERWDGTYLQSQKHGRGMISGIESHAVRMHCKDARLQCNNSPPQSPDSMAFIFGWYLWPWEYLAKNVVDV